MDYNSRYYNTIRKKYSLFATEIVPIIYAKYHPKTVVDVGCGIGLYLAEFYKLGVAIKGYDFSHDAKANSAIPQKFFELFDLNVPLADTKYDLCICSEVGEHLPNTSADTLVSTICSLSNHVLFTAAHPGQTGSNHINEQPQEYWIQKFIDCGYVFQKTERDNIKERMRKLKSFRDDNCLYMNLMLFMRAL
jgi:SAM-dependent methyltransferase